MTNQTPVEYCRHENCGKEIVPCNATHNPQPLALFKDCAGWVHKKDWQHRCHNNPQQVAEPADPPRQQQVPQFPFTELEWTAEEIKNFSEAAAKPHAAPSPELIRLMNVKAGTQMEERKPKRELVGHYGGVPVYADSRIEDGKVYCEPAISESANREPQAPYRKRFLLELIQEQDLRDQKDKSECELQELRAKHEQLTAFSLLQKECVIAAEEMYGACLGAYPNSSETARTEACRKFLQLNDAVGRHPLDDKFLGMSDWKDIAASLRGLVGRMQHSLLLLVHDYEDHTHYCALCGAASENGPLQHLPTCLISEAEAAIKEPHNG